MPTRPMIERLRVTCLARAEQVATDWRATHTFTVLDPDMDAALHPIIRVGAHRLYLLFDQERADATRHFDIAVAEIMGEIERAFADPAHRILIHCHAGASRSTALAYGVLAIWRGAGEETAAFDDLLTLTRKPWPNRRIVEALDGRLGRGGALIAPLDAYRAAYPARIEAYRRLNRRRGIVGSAPR